MNVVRRISWRFCLENVFSGNEPRQFFEPFHVVLVGAGDLTLYEHADPRSVPIWPSLFQRYKKQSKGA